MGELTDICGSCGQRRVLKARCYSCGALLCAGCVNIVINKGKSYKYCIKCYNAYYKIQEVNRKPMKIDYFKYIEVVKAREGVDFSTFSFQDCGTKQKKIELTKEEQERFVKIKKKEEQEKVAKELRNERLLKMDPVIRRLFLVAEEMDIKVIDNKMEPK